MQGAIIDASCAIAVESRKKTVEMGVVPLIDIDREGCADNKSFLFSWLTIWSSGSNKISRNSFR